MADNKYDLMKIIFDKEIKKKLEGIKSPEEKAKVIKEHFKGLKEKRK